MSEFAPVVYVTLYFTPKPRWKRGRRHQGWRWTATSAGNNRTLASGEAFYNWEDCVNSVELLFGAFTDVHLRQAETGNVVLRLASDEKPF